MDLSIIVPIYNTEINKLERCFAGICRLRGIKYECILVDDGSTGETVAFCEHFVAKNPYFKYLKKANGGVSSARNFGIQHASAKYICFVDSDDAIESDTVSAIGRELANEDWDLVITDLIAIHKKGIQRWSAFEIAGGVSYERVVERLTEDGKINGPYCKFVNRQFLRKANVWFNETMLTGEDAVFFMELLQRKPKIWYRDVVSYYYYHTLETGDRRFCKDPIRAIEDLVINYETMASTINKGFFEKHQKDELIDKQKKRLVVGLFGYALDGASFDLLSLQLRGKILKELKKIKKSDLLHFDKLLQARYRILVEKRWLLLKFIAKLRTIYLKVRGMR